MLVAHSTGPSNLHRKQVARLEERLGESSQLPKRSVGANADSLAQLEEQIATRNGTEPVDSQKATVLNFADLGLDPMELEFGYAPELLRASNSPDTNVDIGENSLDWRLATPQMASSLSQHLCEGELHHSTVGRSFVDPPSRQPSSIPAVRYCLQSPTLLHGKKPFVGIFLHSMELRRCVASSMTNDLDRKSVV